MRTLEVKSSLLVAMTTILWIGLMLGFHPAVSLGQEEVENAVKILMVEDPDHLGSGRLHYPLFLSGGKGYRIKCASQTDEEKVIRGLGFISMPSRVVDALEPEVVDSYPEEQPFLCPHSNEFKIKLYRHNAGSGDQFYLQFPTGYRERSYVDNLYIAGCSGVLEGLNLKPTMAIQADPTPFFGENIYKLNCFQGNPITVRPQVFSEWCLKKDLNSEELKTVKALLQYTPVGIAALGEELSCKEAENFLGSLTTLNLDHQQLTDLAPLGSLKNLTHLILSRNRITDLAPLSSLRNLMNLNLGQNRVQNVAPLAALAQLAELDVSGNQITDVRPLSSLRLLRRLSLSRNGLIDFALSSVAYLTGLKDLDLSYNKIVSPAALKDLSELENLDLRHNMIDSTSSLSGLATTVNIRWEGNPLRVESFAEFCALKLADASPVGHTLRMLVESTRETNCLAASSHLESSVNLNLEGKSLVDITPLRFFPHLRELNLSNNNIEQIGTLTQLTQLRRLKLSKNNIRQVDALLPLIHLTELEIKENPLELKTFASWCLLRGQTDWVSESEARTVLALKNLEGEKNCAQADQMLNATRKLKLENMGLSSLTPLSTLRHIQALYLGHNQLTDLTPLKELTSLLHLDLSGNGELSVLDTLKSLPQLEKLWLQQTKVQSLSAMPFLRQLHTLDLDSTKVNSLHGLQHLTQLTDLSFNYTGVQDIKLLADLPRLEKVQMLNAPIQFHSYLDYCLVSKFHKTWSGDVVTTVRALEEQYSSGGKDPRQCREAEAWTKTLTSLNLKGKGIKDLSPLRFFSNLTGLYLGENSIVQLWPLQSLTALETLGLDKNAISDISSLGNLKALKKLYLEHNKIHEVQALNGLPQLEKLILHHNRISNPSSLTYLPNMKILDLMSNSITSVESIRSLISAAMGRGALNTSTRVGVYLKGNSACNQEFVASTYPGMTPDRILDAKERAKNLNTVKKRACTENVPRDFIIIDRPIIRDIITPVRPNPPVVTPIRPRPLPRFPGLGLGN